MLPGRPVQAQTNLSLAPDQPAAQVFIATDPQAVEAFKPHDERVQSMADRCITNLTGKATTAAAWLSIVNTQDVVGIKVFSEPGPNSGTRHAVVRAVVRGLLDAGLPPGHIIIWDKRQPALQRAGFVKVAQDLGVRIESSMDSGWDEAVFYETSLLGNLVWGDLEFGKKGEGVGRKSFVSKLVTREITKIINITPLMNHNEAGVTGLLFSLALGSVDNTLRFESDASRLAVAVPEIYALPALSDRVVLSIVDALICQYEGEERSLLHYSTPLNQLRFSRDPVALDVLSIQELDRQRTQAKATAAEPRRELFENASLLELGVSEAKKIQVIQVP